MNKVIKPDYHNCIMNISSSILKYFAVQPRYSTIAILDKFLSRDYKNIVLMIFDGMGMDMIEHNLPETSFLRSNIKQQLTSVFPSTTAAAMITYYTGLPPVEQDWPGWFLYFRELNTCIESYKNVDKLIPSKLIFQNLAEANSSLSSYTIIPEGIIFPDRPNTNIRIKNVEDIFTNIKELAEKVDKKFIMSYWFEPDRIMHQEGCYGHKVKSFMQLIDDLSLKMYESLNDTLLIISADHGLINTTEEVYLNDIPEIDECLVKPPTMESRAVSLFIKPGMETIFKERFYKYFREDFLLMSIEQISNSDIFGKGKLHKKVSDYLGDYLACAVGNKMIRYRTQTGEQYPNKGEHGGLTEEEILVPLIILE